MHKILVVDDEPEIVKILEEFLTRNGFEVVTAGGGEKAIGILKSDTKIDLMLLDMKMPGVKGLDILDELIRLNKDIPFIILTGSTGAPKFNSRLKRMRFNSISIVQKPADLYLLLDMIKKKFGLGK